MDRRAPGDRRRPRRHARRRSGGRHRQDDRAGEPHPARARDRPRDDDRDRRGHVHGEGGRRAEAAAARGARARARAAATDAEVRDAARGRARDARGSARQHDSRLLRRAAARAAGRGARRSAVRGPHRAAGRPALRARVSRLAAGGAARARPKGCGARCGGRARPSFGGGDGGGPIDRLRSAGRDARRVARLPAAVAAAAVRSRRRDRPPGRGAAPLRRPDGGAASSDARQPVRRHRRGPPAEPADSSSSSRSASAISTAGRRASSISRATAACRARGRAAATSSARTSRGPRCSPRATRSSPICSSSARTPTPIWPRACSRSSPARPTRYQELKQAAGALDFADLLARARDLIETNADVRAPPAAEVRAHLRRRVPGHRSGSGRDPAAAAAIRRDTTSPARQALHRRRSEAGDLPVPRHRRRHVLAGVQGSSSARGGRVLQLTTSYRSVPAIQRFVNAAFAPEMTGDEATRQADYVPLAPSRAGRRRRSRRSSRCRCRGRTGAAVRRAQGVGEGDRGVAAGRRRRLHRVAGRREERLDRSPSGRRTAPRARVPLQPRHIAVLFRRFVSFGEDVTRRYVDAIEARGIPHLLVGGKAFHGREEVETIRAALAAIEWPDDELSVFATLKGSLFAIDDEHLLEFRHRFGAFHPFRIPKELGGNSRPGAGADAASRPRT